MESPLRQKLNNSSFDGLEGASPLTINKAYSVENPTFKQALARINGSAWRMSAYFFFNNLTRIITLHYLRSDKNSVELAAVNLGCSIINVMCIALFVMLTVGLGSRLSQAYGASEGSLLKQYLHRGFVINCIVLVFIFIFQNFIGKILLGLNYQPDFVEYIQRFLSYTFPSYVGYMIFQTFCMYLNSCKQFHVMPRIQGVACCINWVVSYFFIEVYDLGLVGAALAVNVQQICACIIMIIYVCKRNPVPKTLTCPDKKAFRGLWELFKYEVIAGSMIYLEWFAYEVMTLMSGIVGFQESAGLTISLTFYSLTGCIGTGANVSTSSLIGNSMGENNPVKAKTYLKAAVTFVCLWAVVAVSVGEAGANPIAAFFTEDPDIQHQIATSLRVLMIGYIPDTVQSVFASCMRSIGKEKLGCYIIIFCLYVYCLPLAYVLCFVYGYGVMGIIFSIITSVMLSCAMYAFVLFARVDWKNQAVAIQKALKEDKQLRKA